MQTLSFGFKKPEDGDKGNIFFPALEDNIQQLNDHDHNGTNSKKIPSSSVEAVTETILAANWIEITPDNLWQQQITVPSGIDLTKTALHFTGSVSGDKFNITPIVRIITATVYYVQVNDPALELIVHYVS